MEAAGPDRTGGRAKPPDDHVFVIRLWLERGLGGGRTTPRWRGRVKYLNRDEEVHVNGIEGALDVVRATLRQIATDSPK